MAASTGESLYRLRNSPYCEQGDRLGRNEVSPEATQPRVAGHVLLPPNLLFILPCTMSPSLVVPTPNEVRMGVGISLLKQRYAVMAFSAAPQASPTSLRPHWQETSE